MKPSYAAATLESSQIQTYNPFHLTAHMLNPSPIYLHINNQILHIYISGFSVRVMYIL